MFYPEELDMFKEREIYNFLLTVNVIILTILFPLLNCLTLEILLICHVLQADSLRSSEITVRGRCINPIWLNHREKNALPWWPFTSGVKRNDC